MSLLLKYLKQYKKLLFLALSLATINQVFSLLDPQIFRLIIDEYATKFDVLPKEAFLQGVVLLLLAAMGVAFVSRVAKNFQDYYVSVITQRIGAQLYNVSVAHSFSLPYAVFEDQRSGELLQKLQKARTDAQQVISGFVNIVFLSLIGILFVLIYAFTVNWLIGMVYTLIIPVLGAITFWITRRIKKVQQTIVKETAELAGSTTETLRNVELVKSLGLEEQEVLRLNTVNEKILELELKKVRMIRKLSFVQGTMINLLRSLLMFLMLWLIAEQSITLGQFFSLLFYSFFIFNPLAELGNVATQFQEARASMEQLEEILKKEPEDKPKNPKTVETLTSLAFQDASFSYHESDRPAVSGINLNIKGGQTIAFVGPSGSGKSTLVKLLVGLYHPTAGKLLVNNTDSMEIDYEELRKRIGLVTQETQLFAGTIRENLLFVRPDATDAECVEVMQKAAAVNIIERGGKGLDTKIGEGGIKISGGERQRLAIARALLRRPELIIFDEATSSLDSITEKAITHTIREITASHPNLMTVLVAHRLSTIAQAQTIYVLEKGKIIEQGSHQELLKIGGLYAALWREQSAVMENNGQEG